MQPEIIYVPIMGGGKKPVSGKRIFLHIGTTRRKFLIQSAPLVCLTDWITGYNLGELAHTRITNRVETRFMDDECVARLLLKKLVENFGAAKIVDYLNKKPTLNKM